MSFGPELPRLPASVPARASVTATLTFTPGADDFSQEAHVYVADSAGVRVVILTARSPARDEP